ncbi:agarase [Saccharobesus litoralis]|uniref:Agarase n=1 Tax=Saccharobesus litoralis TaxID=2172099 RepID=A0A2S0VXE5_9ALTE|nr:agarase [Saccharobesus litoralis]
MRMNQIALAVGKAITLSLLASNAMANTVVKQDTSGMCFNTANGSANPANGTEVVLSSNCSGGAAGFSWTSGGSVKHIATGKCIHPGGSATPDNGQKLVLWDGCDFADRVKFDATWNSSLQHVSGGKCVHPNGGSANPAEGTGLVLWDGCNEDRLKFVQANQSTGGGNPSTGDVSVNINLDMKHAVDLFDQFDRRKFITLHASHTENDWFGGNAQSLGAPNADPNLMTNFLEDYDVYFGRDTGGMAYHLTQLPEDASKQGYASASHATTNGGNAKWLYSETNTANAQVMRSHAHRDSDLIVGAQQHPYYPDGTTINGQSWSFSQTDTTAEPLGTATGDYISQYVSKYFNQGPNDPYGQKKPTYVEVMNEPLFELHDYPHAGYNAESIHDIFRMHNSVANVVRANNPDVKIGGFTVAFPDYEKGSYIFENWNTRDKYFLDLAGNNMDFISVHLYDFPNFPHSDGSIHEQYRKGSNIEATLDLLENYMAYKWGAIKPILVSEYGSQLQGSFGTPWSPERDWLCLKAMNSMIMNFMERPNRIDKAIPFIPVKAEWGRISDSIPYYWRLMRQAKEGAGESGDQWVYTEQVKFYQLWSEVKGTRIDTWASDLDIQVDAYADGKDVYVILNSLEFGATDVDLSFLGASGNNVTNVKIKHLYPDGSGKPILQEYNQAGVPSSITLGAESTMILKVSHANNVVIDQVNQETKHYGNKTVQYISANVTNYFNINGVSKGNYGEAILRIGVGRNHGASLTPTVTVNGTSVSVPTDYRGYEQQHGGKGRDRFFGVLEIPVPYGLLQTNNSIGVTFPDSGGSVSTVTLQNFAQTRAVTRN